MTERVFVARDVKVIKEEMAKGMSQMMNKGRCLSYAHICNETITERRVYRMRRQARNLCKSLFVRQQKKSGHFNEQFSNRSIDIYLQQTS